MTPKTLEISGTRSTISLKVGYREPSFMEQFDTVPGWVAIQNLPLLPVFRKLLRESNDDLLKHFYMNLKIVLIFQFLL